MKHSGICPKCKSSNIWNNAHINASKNFPNREWIIVRSGTLFNKIIFKEEYICTDCGYSESFVDDKGLATIDELKVKLD